MLEPCKPSTEAADCSSLDSAAFEIINRSGYQISAASILEAVAGNRIALRKVVPFALHLDADEAAIDAADNMRAAGTAGPMKLPCSLLKAPELLPQQ